MTSRIERIAHLKKLIQERILVIDGAMGTAIQEIDPSIEEFGGEQYEGCNEMLVLTAPHLIEQVHKMHIDAGADIIETDTFGGTPLVLEEYQLGNRALEINSTAAKIARRAADQAGRPVFVAGSMGPTTKAISVTGGVSFEELIQDYRTQAKGLIQGDCDYLLLETCQDARNIKAGIIGIREAFEELKLEIPIAISGTIEAMGTTLAGQSIEALLTSVEHVDLLYIGLNCATGPEFMTDHLRSLAEMSPFPIACVPNAGLPDEEGRYLETPDMVARVVEGFMNESWINLVGGCCGTTAEHIAALRKVASGKTPRVAPKRSASTLSGIEYLEITDDLRPVIVGERTNVIGSRKFKRLITEGKWDESTEVARAQIKKGAHIIDICLANPDRDELEDMERFLEQVVKKIKVPIMIDSTDDQVIARALTYCQGKSIINSINLEDGEERFEQVIPLAKKFGAALVVGTIDDDPEQGMAVTRERKLEVARRSYKLLTEKYGVSPSDIYWDPLVFPCATGDEQYIGSAAETIHGLKLIKDEFPLTKTVLGISNVSFGLPAAGREILNSVFLYHCVQSGLDLAIVNSEKLERFAAIPEDEKKLAEDLLFNRGEDPIAAFADHFRDKSPKAAAKPAENMSLDERLAYCIVEGSKEGLHADLDEALKGRKPIDIINGPLMAGMDEVGKLFNDNKLIVAEVLQSAEVMKSAVAHLEPHMEKSDSSCRGKVLLATVKGDVHDIGKNLVDIILSNNGFEVVNLGIKIPPQTLIEETKKHNPDIIGLSGLLVKSAQQMVITAEDMKKKGIDKPVLVGGAALSRNFVHRKIAPEYPGHVFYAKDAMNGLDLAKEIVDPVRFPLLQERLAAEREASLQSPTNAAIKRPREKARQERSSKIEQLPQVPQPTDYERHIVRGTPIDQIWKYINPLMLYTRHLGLKGGVVKKLSKMGSSRVEQDKVQAEHPKEFEIWQEVHQVMEDYRGSECMQPVAVYQFFRARSQGNSIWVASLKDPNQETQFEFGRQDKEDGLCLADYVATPEWQSQQGYHDNLCFFAVSVGKAVRYEAEKLKNQGVYLRSHILQALAIESAEAYAELLHSQIRSAWGHSDTPGMTMMDRFQAKYLGKRYSFGYPACPNLEDQKKLFDLIRPEEIGIELTDGFMMDPEASVTALAFHHPQASYFSIGGSEDLPR